MQTLRVDRAAIGVWRWQGWVSALTCAIGAGVLSFGMAFLWPVLPVAVFVAGAAFAWFWPPLHYRHLEYAVDAAGISIHRGVLWRSRIALPRARIQHTDVAQGPLQRRFGVATLKFYTAGSRYTEIELSGLAYEDAVALRAALLAEDRVSGV